MDWSACKTRELKAEEDCMQWDRDMLMRLTKSEGGRRVTPSFSGVEEGRRSGQQERASGPASWDPGTWIIVRLKSARSRSQHAWQQFSTWGLQK